MFLHTHPWDVLLKGQYPDELLPPEGVKELGFSPNPYSSQYIFISAYSSQFSFKQAFAISQSLLWLYSFTGVWVCVTSHNTLVTYTDKNSKTNADKIQSSAFKLWTTWQTLPSSESSHTPWQPLVPSPVMHPSANSDQLRVLSHAPVTRLCHTPLSHTLGHPPPL